MSASTIISVFAVGAGGGLLAGLLGIGGAVAVIPALIYFTGLPIHTATSISIVQSLAASVTALSQFRGQRTLDVRTATPMAGAAVLGGLVGGSIVRDLPPSLLTVTLFGVILIAIGLLALPSGRMDEADYHLAGGKHQPNRVLGAILAGATGLAGGLLGAGGGFLVLPIMNAVLRMPLRVAISSSLFVVAATTGSSFVGRLLAGQVELVLGFAVTASAIPFALIGSRISRRTPTTWLRVMLAGLLVIIAARLLLTLFGS